MNKNLEKTIKYLKKKKKILFLTTSNRWSGAKDEPKSTLLAKKIASELDNKSTIINVSKLNIYPCEGNVSKRKDNDCGEKFALLKDKEKNPSQCHRCWASLNHSDDELWKVSKELFQSDCVIFFGSVRWGQMNSIYQKLIERLTWIENRHSTFGESNLLKNIDAGLICTGHNWNGKNVTKTQKQVLEFFGFKIPDELFWNWQYTNNADDESQESYKSAYSKFIKEFDIAEC
jgi:multimeric flavodoxin WrbA